MANLSGPNPVASRDPWDYESFSSGIRMAQSLGERESDRVAANGVQPCNSHLTTGTKAYNPPMAYMGVWATKQELPGGSECRLPAQVFDPKPIIYEKPIQARFIKTG